MKIKLHHIIYRAAIKKTVLVILLLFPFICFAQTDTTVLLDSLVPSVIEEDPPAVVQESTADDDKPAYFLEKWQYPEDSFTVQQRKIPDDQLRKMQQDDNFWYANAGIKKEKPEKEESGPYYTPLGQRAWFQNILWIVIIVSFAAFVAIYLSGNNVSLFRKNKENIADGSEEDEIPEDIFAINYQREIDKASNAGNYRLAIRLMFLRLLKQMSERDIIKYKQDKTNFDYLVQLQPTGYYENFFRITRNYEYSWYGKFPVSEDVYKQIRNDFDRFGRQFY